MLGALVLAAGASTRYGRDKLLIPLADGRPLGSLIVQTLLPHVDKLIVVLGPGQRARQAMYDRLPVQTLVSPASEAGMGHSLAAGVAALEGCDAYLIALADMPWIAEATVHTLVRDWRADSTHGILRPRWRGMPGHPVVIGRAWRHELLTLRGDVGARDILERHAARIRYCDVEDDGVVRDVDRPADVTNNPAAYHDG